jgi:hypothetical protein
MTGSHSQTKGRNVHLFSRMGRDFQRIQASPLFTSFMVLSRSPHGVLTVIALEVSLGMQMGL